jgi:hypothetical protein
VTIAPSAAVAAAVHLTCDLMVTYSA